MTGKRGEKFRKPLTATMEDYLEVMFDLQEKNGMVRVKDIAEMMKVKMPTVTSMLKTLHERGLVKYEKYECIELTEKGVAVGGEMRKRHDMARRFLSAILRIEPSTADVEACGMEHAMGRETLERLGILTDFMKKCPGVTEAWLSHFDRHLSTLTSSKKAGIPRGEKDTLPPKRNG